MTAAHPHPLIADYIKSLDVSFSESGQIIVRLWKAHGFHYINGLIDNYFNAQKETP